jgi:hypothetical protein
MLSKDYLMKSRERREETLERMVTLLPLVQKQVRALRGAGVDSESQGRVMRWYQSRERPNVGDPGIAEVFDAMSMGDWEHAAALIAYFQLGNDYEN